MNSLDGMKARRRWFDSYLSGVDADGHEISICGRRYTCPCCGYTTLADRGGFGICSLCFWEDDGQDDPEANEVFGGPNSHYSLTQARRNFLRYLTMYDLDGDPRIPPRDNEARLAAKRHVTQAFEEMYQSGDPQQSHLCSQVEEGFRALLPDGRRRAQESEHEP